MKKALLLVSILFVSVVSTACINNFAVQELNTKAKLYMEEGNYKEAIERLKSSIDLDNTIFETHYNLAVAYTQAEDYPNAIDAYEKAIKLDDSFPDVYYSLAVAQGNLAVDLKNGNVRVADDGSLFVPSLDQLASEADFKPSNEILGRIKNLYAEAVENYEIYLQKSPEATDADEVKQKIAELKDLSK